MELVTVGPSGLLSLPFEIRHHIYSYLLLNSHVMSMTSHDMDRPLHNALLRTCRQMREEGISYYYFANTFLLSLLNPVFVKRFRKGTKYRENLVKHLRRMRKLQVVLGLLSHLTPEAMDSRDDFALSCRERMQSAWDWFCGLLGEAKTSSDQRPWLKNLAVIDRVRVPPDFESSSVTREVDEWREKREAILPILEDLKGEVQCLTVESRVLPQGPCAQLGTSPFSLRLRKHGDEPASVDSRDTVLGISYLKLA